MQSRELRTGVQMKLPCINVHTHTEATRNAIQEEDLRTEKTQNVLFFSEILLMTASLRLRWPHYSLRSYHVGPSKTFQISCCITVKEKKIAFGGAATSEGHRPLALATTEQCWHVQRSDRWTEWERKHGEPCERSWGDWRLCWKQHWDEHKVGADDHRCVVVVQSQHLPTTALVAFSVTGWSVVLIKNLHSLSILLLFRLLHVEMGNCQKNKNRCWFESRPY